MPKQELKQVIAKLNGIVLKTQREVASLCEAQRALRLRAVSAEVALMHCSALLRLAALRGDPLAAAVLPAPSGASGGGGGGRGGGGAAATAGSGTTSGGDTLSGDSALASGSPAPAAASSGDSADAASTPAAAALRELQDYVRDLLSELEAVTEDGAAGESDGGEMGASGGGGGDPGGSSGGDGGGGGSGSGVGSGSGRGGRARSRAILLASAGLPFDLDIHWSPERAAANADSHDTSPLGIRAKIVSLTQSFGPLLLRVTNGAYNADAAARRIEALRTDGLEFAALIRSHAGAEPVLDTHLAPVLAEPGDDSYPMGPPPPSHFEFAVKQMELTPEQEELIVVHLSAWKERADDLMARRESLLALCRDVPDVGDREEAIAQVEFLQTIYLLVHAAYDLGFNDTLISPVQFAALLLASFPYIPSPPAVLQALLQVRAARGAEAEAAAGPGGGAAAEAGGKAKAAPRRAL
ncbi:hypothetical protein Rsub_05082 [Raphidocelis subcapitata]|uniref:Uncharacterized protein n=1 Tax=Raphidocelis subcapitata TaxID=307507 RepID=A0A2V0P4D1_9CHLO|nr:hypothetical protein Rsub_05082 [Raphidocelis subcapitata]|eukprot:GBF92713.1 hypothetical protein Rsub_05082 [Raphidocelis subcapitata]